MKPQIRYQIRRLKRVVPYGRDYTTWSLWQKDESRHLTIWRGNFRTWRAAMGMALQLIRQGRGVYE